MKILSHKLAKPLLFTTGVLSLLGQFARSQSPFGFVSWYEIAMFAFVLCCLPLVTMSRIKNHWKKLLPLVSFILWTLLTTLFHREVSLIGSAYLARLTLYILFGAALKLFLDEKIVLQREVKQGVMIWLCVFAFLGISQFVLLPDTRMFFYIGWDDHLSRAFATLFDPGYFGLLMVSGVLLTLWDVKTQKYWWHQILLAVFLIATALSYSRASYLALVVGITSLAYFTQTKKMLLILPLFIMSLVLLPKDGGGAGQNLLRTQTLAMREEVAQIHTRSLEWKDQLYGRGWFYEKALSLHANELGSNQKGIQRQNSGGVDNAFLHVFLSTGAIGSLLFLVALIVVFVSSKSTFWKALFLAVSAHSFFSLGMFYPWIMLVLAITFFLREEPSPHKKTTESNS